MMRIKKGGVYILLFLPALIFLIGPAAFDLLEKRPIKTLLVNSGYCALGILALSLLLAPLSKHFPKIKLFKGLNQRRRIIGISVFIYASFHLSCVMIKTYLKYGRIPLEYFLKPMVYTGLFAYIIFLALTITSNDYSIRTLGYKAWKWIHRFVYAAEILIFFHVFQKSPLLSIVIFAPLILTQILRFRKGALSNRH